MHAYIVLGLIIMFESTGIPLPAESLLILLSVYAARTHHLSMEGIMSAAIIGAILGDNLGYLIGHYFGYRLLERHGSKVGINEDRLLLGRYLFRRFGGLGILFGRFLAILRIFIALLAGATRMPWKHFMFYNALGGIIWGAGYVFVAYTIGDQMTHFSGPIGPIIGGLLIVSMLSGLFFLHRHEHTLVEKAKRDEGRGEQAPQ
ncbi:hypothetical protein AA15669_0323 [Saccharibacter floricola DSM 15669]|uniref:VTT domain-containing protein n=2 Tax=Saccharibacter TaxID=231052 RepID=A0ABQ0NX40_9PROT|nr:hypothetical protein AA15669_0323 [Saccharibacter floricola DSM 15669]